MQSQAKSITFLNFFVFSLQGHEHYNPQKKNYIFLRGNATEELRPRNRKR